jgi:hypothetical protein
LRFIFRSRQGEQGRALRRIHEQIEIAFLSVGLGRCRSEHSRIPKTVAIQEPPPRRPLNRKGFRWFHENHLALADVYSARIGLRGTILPDNWPVNVLLK